MRRFLCLALTGLVIATGAGACGSPDSAGGGATAGAGDYASDYDCSDFASQADAQAQSDSNGDTDGLDADSDGVACESLP